MESFGEAVVAALIIAVLAGTATSCVATLDGLDMKNECQKELPRNETCELIAVPTKGK